ncbi:unnamed protein product [Psylliodes chrysocephalus]|uniref:Uncharacterized protein n=1 Tax=Psylliodes chrysocephalus TaxID=3402493 RepID=A0A9P0CG74_9CUCU|nr:unnamed protein product [Psylliodes chrysocephala]
MVLRIPLGKFIVCVIAFTHLIFLYDGIYSMIQDEQFYAREDDLQYEERVQAIFLYGLHIVLIYLLIYSAYKNIVSLLIPWLGITFPVFIYMTFKVLRDMKWYRFSDLLDGFIDVGICWLFWTFTYYVYKSRDYRNYDILDKGYFYINYFLKIVLRRV